MTPSRGALVVFGSGPGVGRSVAALYAERGSRKVILMSRNGDRLAQDAAFVRSANAETKVYEIVTDLGDTEQVQNSLKRVEESLEGMPLECILFNAARTAKSEFFKFSATELENDLKIAIVSLYAVTQWAMPRLLKSADSNTNSASLVVTSGMLAKDPFPAMFSLATCKAGQYSLVHSLHKEFESKGVHCGVVIIGGTVAEESKVTNPRNIAEEIWAMSHLPKGEGKLEVILEDPAYQDHIKNRER